MSTSKHLVQGPISPDFVSQKISEHQSKKNIGANSFFLGQIRADEKEGRYTTGIEYSAYEDMVGKVVSEIKDDLFSRYDDLICLHIYHSTGLVRVGEVSLMVLISSGHRKQAFPALQECVELIKEKLPVWKKEIYEDGSHFWKEV